MSGYTKLFNSILTSTIWCGQDAETKVVWITMLAAADRKGVVDVTLPGLAKLSEVPVDKVKTVLDMLSSPDSVNSMLNDDGRRIKALDHGWLLLNYKKYRNARNYEERKAYMRKYMRDYMKKRRTPEKLDVVRLDVKQELAHKHKQIPIDLVPKERFSGGGVGEVKSLTGSNNQEQAVRTFHSPELRSHPIKCVMPGCENPARPGQQFCSDNCKDYAHRILNRV